MKLKSIHFSIEAVMFVFYHGWTLDFEKKILRFEGETYDHVLEVIKEARDKCEAEGRIRRAQILEAVLVANEPTGNLAKRRAVIEKLFEDNNNILTGQVINELDKQGIPYKEGENYLLASEIIKKTF